MPRVLKRAHFRAPLPPNSVLVARPSRYGNTFSLPPKGDRLAVVEAHRQLVLAFCSVDPAWAEPLRGKDLVCYCAPEPCHADTLLELANLVCRDCGEPIEAGELVECDAAGRYSLADPVCPRCHLLMREVAV